MLKLCGGTVYDPLNNINGEVRDVLVQDGKIIEATTAPSEPVKEYDVSGKVIMPGAIDIHTHIGGGKVNIARCMMCEQQSDDLIVPGTVETGLRYAEMGYTACFEPAMIAANSRQAHYEMADTPIVDVGAYVMLGNDDFFMQLLANNASHDEIRDYVGWTLDATQALAVKVVNPGGINAFKFNVRGLDIDERTPYYDVTPRAVVQALTRALDELGVPHPLHTHTSNLGVPGNYESTLKTIGAAEGRPLHLTHVQFHSYGTEGKRAFSSAAQEIADAINKHTNVSTDVGQVMFGQTVTTSSDTLHQYLNSAHASPNKWVVMDIECEAGCGVVPFKYRDQNFVNALQWAIGLEIFLLTQDPWRVFLTTDHPNGGPFDSYPHLIALLMQRNYRNDILSRLHPQAQEMTLLKQLDREYSLYEIAIVTRAAPAKSLGLQNKGHLGSGADADIVVYEPSQDPEAMFARPLYVFKHGELVVKDGQVVAAPTGRTHVVKPEYDDAIEKRLKKYYAKYHNRAFENIAISDDEMSEAMGSPIVVHPCQSH